MRRRERQVRNVSDPLRGRGRVSEGKVSFERQWKTSLPSFAAVVRGKILADPACVSDEKIAVNVEMWGFVMLSSSHSGQGDDHPQ